MNFSIHSRRGQTLVEALVALSILTVGFVGIVTLLTKSFQLNRTTSNDTQATYLAAEGIEVAKNIVDYDVYYGLRQSSTTNDWGCSFDLNVGQRADYALAYDIAPTDCATPPMIQSPTGDELYLITDAADPDVDMYTYNGFGNQPTDFTRDVWITAVSNNELDVQSTVTWTDGGQSNTITLEDHFYNWRQ